MAPDPAASSRPAQIGPYRILDTLGEGGMGIVYLAEQKEPVRRRAALKVIKLGMDSKAVLTRFEAERRALAMMEHSCIATVFDAGITAEGQPFFAMEYVKGIPITDYCDQNKLSVKERIELFQKVCSGVQHAHLKGVMHRDLKPSNVLVTLQDGKPLPKIIDFGLAKATDHHLVEATIYTEQGQVIGTPEYMSPEQAGLGGLDVDTRTDVYSLGVLLYELLVGELPFSRKDLRGAGYLEMQRVIREQEPVKPSTKVTTIGELASGHASARRLQVRELRRELRGDLDWIVLKALEKDRTRRFETALELAADLQRHLDFEPVLASPPSARYRLKKFVRRYRVQCVAAGVVSIAIVGGSIGTYLQYVRAEANAKIAQASERAARENEARAVASEARAKEQELLANTSKERVLAMMAEADRVHQWDRIYADATRLNEALAIEETLYPAHPDKIPAMEDWLANHGMPLLARLPELQAALAALRREALPRHDGDPQLQRERHPRLPELRNKQAELLHANDKARRTELREQIATIENEIALAEWTFADRADSYRHRTLTRLVHELQDFVGERGKLEGVRARLSAAQTVQQRTIDDHRPAWDAAIAALMASDGTTANKLYEHLVLTPQLGLVPIGMDRESRLWEFLHLASGAPGREIPSRDPQTGRVVPDGEMGIVFVLLPTGTVPAWSPEGRTLDDLEEVEPFFLSKYEMTVGQWHRLTGDAGNARNLEGPANAPARAVDWFECTDLLRRHGLVLPSALQSEFGSRAGTETHWWSGSQPESLYGKENVQGKHGYELMAVGCFAPNPFGLFDALGNVWEWCLDECDLQAGPGSGFRIVRGGVYSANAEQAYWARRRAGTPATRTVELGLRPARLVWP